LLYKVDAILYFYTEIFDRQVINFGDLTCYRIDGKDYLLRSGLWKNSEYGNYCQMSNLGMQGILEEYRISKDIERIDGKIQSKRVRRKS